MKTKKLFRLISFGLIQLFLVMDCACFAGGDFLSPALQIEGAFKRVVLYSENHVRRNNFLEALIAYYNVVRIIEDGAGSYQAIIEEHEKNRPDKDNRILLNSNAKKLLSKLQDNLKDCREEGLLREVLEDNGHLRIYSAQDREKLIFIAQHVPLLVVKGRVTLYDGASFSHTRRGDYYQTGRLINSAIWIEEKAITDLLKKDLALLLLEESQHILKPFAEHKGKGNVDGTIVHSTELFNELRTICKYYLERLPEFFCETDIFSLSLQLRQSLTLRQLLEQKLELKQLSTITLTREMEQEYGYLERVLPDIFEQAEENGSLKRYKKHGFLPERIKDLEKFKQYSAVHLKSKEYKRAHAMAQKFKWPKQMMEMFYVYESRNKEAETVLTIAIKKAADAIKTWQVPEGDFPGFVKGLNSIIRDAIREIIKRELLAGLNLERLYVKGREDAEKYLGAELFKRWDEYRANRKSDGADALFTKELRMIGEEEFVNLDKNIDISQIIKVLQAAREKFHPKSLPDATVELLKEVLADIIEENQQDYFKSGKISDIEPLKQEDIIDEVIEIMGTGITKKRIKGILKGMNEIICNGQYYALFLLIPDDNYPDIQAKDIIASICRDNNCKPNELEKENNPELFKFLKEELIKRCRNYYFLKEMYDNAEVSDEKTGQYIETFIKETEKQQNSSGDSQEEIRELVKEKVLFSKSEKLIMQAI